MWKGQLVLSAWTTLALCVFMALGGCTPAGLQLSPRDEALQHAPLIEQPMKVPLTVSGPSGPRTYMLDGLMIRPALNDERLPLIVFTHGTPRQAEDRRKSDMAWFARIARDFARRGWAAAVVIRRGHGASEGDYVEGIRCADPDYIHAGTTAAQDIESAVGFFSQLPYVDGTRILGAGHSTGGFAWLAFSAKTPPNLAGVINFAGGHGSPRTRENCSEEKLVAAMREFGKTSRVPSLWFYSENDSYIAPDFARRLRSAFVDAGGSADLTVLPPYQDDGHDIVLKGAASPLWTPEVDKFLSRLDLPTWSKPDAHPELLLTAAAREHYANYLEASPEKAFAISSDGSFDWWWSGLTTTEEARKKALADCEKGVRACRIYAVNFAPLPRDR